MVTTDKDAQTSQAGQNIESPVISGPILKYRHQPFRGLFMGLSNKTVEPCAPIGESYPHDESSPPKNDPAMSCMRHAISAQLILP